MTSSNRAFSSVHRTARWHAGVFLIVSVLAAAPVGAVSLNVVSPPPVRNSGDTATVCVDHNSAGDSVVGVENELVWSTSCASIVGECTGENLRMGPLPRPAPGSTGIKAIVLNLQNLSPLPNGTLYCCNLRVHPEVGSCCAIGIENTRSSDANGKALSTSGRPGQVCLASSGQTGGGLEGGSGPEPPPVIGADLGPGAQQPSGQAQPQGQTGGGGPIGGGITGVPPRPPAVVLPGGGEQVAQAPGEAAQTPTAAVPAPGQAAPAQPAAPGTAPVRTAAATPATPAATPAQAAVAEPTKAAATAKPKLMVTPQRPVETKRALAATPQASGSGCHCQIGTTGDGWSALPVLLSLGAILWARRRRL